MNDRRVVQVKDAERIVKELNLLGYCETSAKDGSGVNAPFDILANAMLGESGSSSPAPTEGVISNISENGDSKEKRKKCCI
jgi:hypothetical protein